MVDRKTARDIEWNESLGGHRGHMRGPNNLARRSVGMPPIDAAGVQANRERIKAAWARLQRIRTRNASRNSSSS